MESTGSNVCYRWGGATPSISRRRYLARFVGVPAALLGAAMRESGMSVNSLASPVIVYDGAVTRDDLNQWNSDLDALLARLTRLFYRTESRRHAEQYVRGLLAPLQRKNGWTIAEYVGESEPKALQRFLNLTPWNVAELLELNRDYAMEHLASEAAILVADPTGFAKKGRKSVGVQRQYSGTLGRIDNCQIATFLAYVTPGRDRVLLDRRLYLPRESWLADRDRCAEAGVPDDLAFKTRPEQVIEMIDAAVAAHVPFAWFSADEEFGQNPGLRDHLHAAGIGYVMAVPKNTTLADPAGQEIQLSHRAAKLNHTTWQRRACGIGTKGHRVYNWALLPSADPDHQYLIRKSIDDGELAYYHCYNPRHAGFGELVNVAGARWPIEECFGAGKNEVGLDQYQVRTYDAWHRHITLAMLAHTFLAIAAHKTKKGEPAPTGRQYPATIYPTNNPSPTQHDPPFTGNSSPSPSPKYADSSPP
jgi:SRSO17 transposase